MSDPKKAVERRSGWFLSPLRKHLTEDEIRRIWRGLAPSKKAVARV